MVKDKNRVTDGYLSAEGGVDSGLSPSLIGLNQWSWAVNTTFRGGFPRPRPGWIKRTLTFENETTQANFAGLFQGAGSYISTEGVSYIALSVTGRTFLINLQSGYEVTDISIPTDIGDSTAKHVWFQQAERYLITQNKIEAPFLYNGSGSRRSNIETEVPVGGPMAYGQGRLWVADGKEYYGGNLVWSDRTLGRDSIIKFTENTFLNEGGAFSAEGYITGMAFAANLDTSLGQGELLVFNAKSVQAFNAPVDRATWASMQQPIQKFAVIGSGATSHEGITVVNGDLFYRAADGVRSVIIARRDFSEWGNTPISRQIDRAFQYDTISRLNKSSSVTFDNRMLTTTQPQQSPYGTYHRGLAVLDFYNVSGMGTKLPPAWEGVWTGLRILRILKVTVQETDRCFILALNDSNVIDLWEVSLGSLFDKETAEDKRIKWIIESRSMAFKTPTDIKKLETACQWYSDLTGQLDVRARFRGNLSQMWTLWANYTDCAKYRDCTAPEEGECHTPKYFRAQSRPRLDIGMSADVEDKQTGKFTNIGYQFQVRFELEGYAKLNVLEVSANLLGDDIYGDMRGAGCETNTNPSCETSCVGVEQCELDDYSYTI